MTINFKTVNQEQKQYRCEKCGKLLMVGDILLGNLEVKCIRCKEMAKIVGRFDNKGICLDYNCKKREPIE